MKKQNLKPAVCVFSVDKDYRSERMNSMYRKDVRQFFERHFVPYKRTVGQFDGNEEVTFIVSARHELKVIYLTNKYDQECYLYLHPDRAVDMVDPYTRTRVPMGQWIHAPSKPKGDFTFDNGNYYEVI